MIIHTPLTRSEFIRRLILLTGSVTAAMSILPMIEVNAANMKITSEEDLFTERISYTGQPGVMMCEKCN